MSFAKYVILVAGIAGVASFFLPLWKGSPPDLSAMQVLQGVHQAGEQVDQALKSADAKIKLAPKDKEKVEHAFAEFSGTAWLVVGAMYVPFLLFFAIGGVGVARKKLGRLGGLGMLLFGLVSLLVSGLLVIGMTSSDQPAATQASPAIGVWLAILGSGVGVLMGLLLLIKPDRGANW